MLIQLMVCRQQSLLTKRTTSKNPRSTVGTVTEINDYLRLLYARVGTPYCVNGHGKISAQSVEEIVEQILELPEKTRLQNSRSCRTYQKRDSC